MSSMPLLPKQCLAIGLALAAAACAHAGGAAPRAGVGPVASVGEPAPHAGQWSTPHPGSWCNKGSLVKDLGKGVTLAACKAACGVVNSSCAYVCHADESDQRCMLYSTCPDPMSGKPSGWFTTYQYGRAGGAPWVPPPSPSPPSPSPSPTPPSPGAMYTYIVGAATVAAHGAKCLDGSPPAYLVREGTGANASKYVVFLEGGGWCFSVSDCEKRRRGGLGSSARFIPGSTKKDYGGVMAISSTTNPDFHGYTMVFVHYCDGSSMSSFRPNPIKTSDGQDMWFRGKANLAAVLDELRQDHGLGEASEVILSGGSAGGLAVYYHLDYVAAFVRGSAPKARVTGFPDAGFFADLKNTKGQYEYRGCVPPCRGEPRQTAHTQPPVRRCPVRALRRTQLAGSSVGPSVGAPMFACEARTREGGRGRRGVRRRVGVGWVGERGFRVLASASTKQLMGTCCPWAHEHGIEWCVLCSMPCHAMLAAGVTLRLT